MKKNTKLIYAIQSSCLVLLFCNTLFAQSNIEQAISIREDGAAPDASAIFEVQSTTLGMLVPRMKTVHRNAIAAPAMGLLVFDTDTGGFWFYNGLAWQSLNDILLPILVDDDEDTKIQVEETVDEDVIRFDLEGKEELRFLSNPNGDLMIEPSTSFSNLFIGENAGLANMNTDLSLGNTFIGKNTGMANTSGSSNTFLGHNAGNANIGGINNTFIGRGTGALNTTGNYNTFLGGNAGFNNDIGINNTFVGNESGYNNTAGQNNTSLGYRTAYNNTTGNNNIFIGYQTGFENTIGSDNIFIGTIAGAANIDGESNTFVGAYAGNQNTLGSNNTFLGINTGQSNTSGANNTFIGSSAGNANISGNRNTFIGERAGISQTAGFNNVYLGERAGFVNTTGSRNTYLGAQTGLFASTGSDNVFIGFAAGANESGSDKLYIDNSATSNPLIFGDFASNVLRINGRLEIGDEYFDDEGSNLMSLDASLIPNYSGPLSFYDLGGNALSERWDDVVAGDFVTISDGSQKKYIQKIPYGLAAIIQLNPVTYQYLDEPDFAKPSLGLIAQEVLAIVPEVVKTHDIDLNEAGEIVQTPVEILGINYVELVPLLIKGMQEQQSEIERLEEKLNEVLKKLE